MKEKSMNAHPLLSLRLSLPGRPGGLAQL